MIGLEAKIRMEGSTRQIWVNSYHNDSYCLNFGICIWATVSEIAGQMFEKESNFFLKKSGLRRTYDP